MFKDKVSQLLGTKDKEEQAKRIEQLMSVQTVDLIVRFDPRTRKVDVHAFPAGLPVQTAYAILEAAKQQLHQWEVEAAKQVPTSESKGD